MAIDAAPGPAAPARRWPPPRPRPGPAAVLAGLIALYVAVFGALTWRQQSRFGTFGYDMGIYDQGIWLLSRFQEPFVTVRGLNFFAHHLNLVVVLLVPFYWLGAGPHVLYLVETVWLALGAVPVWLLARDRLGGRWSGVALAGCFLLYPSLEWVNWWHFHPDALIVTPLLFAWWLARRGRWRWFAAAVAVALACKEDAALAVAALGVLLACWPGAGAARRVGLVTAAVGTAWFVVATAVVIPRANDGLPPFYGELFPGFGDSLGEAAVGIVRQPDRVAELATQGDRLVYYRDLLAPVAFLPLAAAPVLLIGLPQLAVNVLSGHPYTHDSRFHYTAVLIAAVFAATVEGCARLGRGAHRRRFWVGVVVAASVITNVALSPSPVGIRFGQAWWAPPEATQAAAREALRLVPADAGVAATCNLVPHLTHRRHVYEFPNPWVVTNWGAYGERPPDPGTVDYLVLDRSVRACQHPVADELLAPGGGFATVWSRDGVVVAARARPG